MNDIATHQLNHTVLVALLFLGQHTALSAGATKRHTRETAEGTVTRDRRTICEAFHSLSYRNTKNKRYNITSICPVSNRLHEVYTYTAVITHNDNQTYFLIVPDAPVGVLGTLVVGPDGPCGALSDGAAEEPPKPL